MTPLTLSLSLSLGPPSPDVITVDRLNGTHMLVSWRLIPLLRARGFITSYIIRYQAVIAHTRQGQHKTVPGNCSSATIGGLDQNSQYSVTVSGRTVAGGGDFSNATVVPLPAQSTGIYTTSH